MKNAPEFAERFDSDSQTLRYYGIPPPLRGRVPPLWHFISGWRPLPRLHIPLNLSCTPPKRGTRYYPP